MKLTGLASGVIHADGSVSVTVTVALENQTNAEFLGYAASMVNFNGSPGIINSMARIMPRQPR